MTISLRLNDEDSNLIKKYAEFHNTSVSEVLRQAILEKIEDEYDLKSYQKAIEEYKKNPTTFSHEEVAKMLDLE